MNWPVLSSFEATVDRLATAEDTRANRASFLLEADGVRIGTPIAIPLPCFALYRDEESEDAKRAVVFQAEEADGRRYFGGWLIDDETQIVGFEDDFKLLTEEQIRSEQAAAPNRSLPPTLNPT
jgi:hypothetical protein